MELLSHTSLGEKESKEKHFFLCPPTPLTKRLEAKSNVEVENRGVIAKNRVTIEDRRLCK